YIPENNGNILLPMAFVEGSPMHPAYGAGHATVAGACVTILKAFFDGSQYLNIAKDGSTLGITTHRNESKYAFIPNSTGQRLVTIDTEPLTVDGELNKIAANVSIGRDWAGVHYYSDYTESLKLGEEIAIGLLQEQALTYNPLTQFAMTLNRFDGSSIII
ncbi:MAG: bromoperoxidase, partial [Bacteroidota bacterium]